LEEFDKKSLDTLRMSLSESNLAISKSFLAESSFSDDHCLNHTNLNQQKEDLECVAE
jgi:hypothetical protein